MELPANSSVIGRLLEEISWEGSTVRAYRNGGRGRENVLTAEVLGPLSWLPRAAFLGEVLRNAHGAKQNRLAVMHDIEEAIITLLPDQIELGPDPIVVQPDATITSSGTYTLVEAKRIRPSSFQAHQLPRELVSLVREAGKRSPLLLCILGGPPPVAVAGSGRIPLEEALTAGLPELLSRVPEVEVDAAELTKRIPDLVAWTTWAEIADVIRRQAQLFHQAPNGLDGTVRRLSDAVTQAIQWHGKEDAKTPPKP